MEYGDIGIFFNQDAVKSADTVIYDDNGNVIPLDQRFSPDSDIRYSAGQGQLTDAQRQQLLLEAGIVNGYNQSSDNIGGEINGTEEDARRSAERIRETIGRNYRLGPSWSLKGTSALSINRGDYSGVIAEGKPGYNIFRAALSDSSIKSKRGDPIIWYHGSPVSFSQFEEGHKKSFTNTVGYYFTSSGNVANFYAGRNDSTKNIYPSGIYVIKIFFDTICILR